MKVIAFYLPQFHNIPENDQWWGEGFTEWTNVKSARPIFKGHKQPKIPLNRNYYNLLDDNVKKWQSNMAKQYGIYGFCYYHYWFNGKMLLEKPMEQMLDNKEIHSRFCICWANEPWTKAWVGNEKKVLIAQKYGGEKEWKAHFDYLLPFFKDSRYIYENGKPIIIIYRPMVIPCLKEMLIYWNELAIKAGLPGLHTMCALNDKNMNESVDFFDNVIEWEPHVAKKDVIDSTNKNIIVNSVKKFRRNLYNRFEKITGIDLYRYDAIVSHKKRKNQFMDYDSIWKKIIEMNPVKNNSIPGAFVRWDNTARYRDKATVIKGETPEKFKKYLKLQILHARNSYHTDKIFMYAWNEWAEGGFLEPDEENGYAYLQALKEALVETNEFPEELID